MNVPKMPISILVIILSLCVEAMAITPSYPLRVCGGGKLRIWSESTNSQSVAKLIVEFEAGTGPAGDGLRPGQGSWLDRGMREGEPTRLEYLRQKVTRNKLLTTCRAQLTTTRSSVLIPGKASCM